MMGKACHPLSTALYLKRVEGETRDGNPILPSTISARTHEMTRLPTYRDEGFLRTAYEDVEDYAQTACHLLRRDGRGYLFHRVGDGWGAQLAGSGCNNHRTRCNLNPIDALETFNPREDILRDVYVTEKISTKQGWSHPAPDEAWQHGYRRSFRTSWRASIIDREPLSGMELARDTIATIYAGYLSAERGGAEVTIPR